MFDANKTRMIGLPYGEKNYDDMLSRFHPIPVTDGQTDKQMDGRTDRFAISISRVSKNLLRPDLQIYSPCRVVTNANLYFHYTNTHGWLAARV